MTELKTKKNDASVTTFLASVKDAAQQADARTLVGMFEKVTGEKPKMWGSSIVGFGEFRYVYASGRSGDWLATGFSPRAGNLTVYVMSGFAAMQPLLAKLGKHKTATSCLYIKRLADVDLKVLARIVKEGVARTKAAAPGIADAREKEAKKKQAAARTKAAAKKTATKKKAVARTRKA